MRPHGLRFLVVDGVTIDVERHEVAHVVTERLSALEAKFIGYLVDAQRTVSKAELLRDVWGYREGVDTRAILKVLGRLRPKLGPAGPRLVAVRGAGFRWEGPPWDGPDLAPVGPLFGRQAELEALRAWRAGPPGVPVLLAGPAGIGKTRLVRALTDDGKALAMTDASTGQQGSSASFAKILRTPGPGLVVLDGLDAHDAAGLAGLVGLAVRAPALHVVLCSRRAAHVPAARLLELPPLSDEEAWALFVSRVVAFGWTGNLDRLREPVARLGGLPLAVGLAASRLVSLGVDEWLADIARGFLDLPLGGDAKQPDDTLRMAISASWRVLASNQRDLLVRCAAFAGSFASEQIDWPEGPASRANGLARLRDEGMVYLTPGAHGVERLRLHRPIRDFARERLAERADRAAVLRMHAETILRGPPESFDDLLAVFERFRVEDPELAARAALAAAPVARHAGHGRLFGELAAWAASHAHDPQLRWGAQVQQALSDLLSGRPLEAVGALRIALANAPPSANPALAWAALCSGLATLDRPEEALAASARATAEYQSTGARIDAAAQRVRTAHLYLAGEQLSKAEAALAAAAQTLEYEGTFRHRADLWLQYASLRRRQGAWAKADHFLRLAQDEGLRRGDYEIVGRVSLSRAQLALDGHGVEEAEVAIRRALEATRPPPTARERALLLADLAVSLCTRRVGEARECFLAAEESLRAAGDRKNGAFLAGHRVAFELAFGDASHALMLAEHAVEGIPEGASGAVVAELHVALALALAFAGDLPRAHAAAERARDGCAGEFAARRVGLGWHLQWTGTLGGPTQRALRAEVVAPLPSAPADVHVRHALMVRRLAILNASPQT